MEIKKEETKGKRVVSNKEETTGDNSCLKPKCPYNQETDSELTCPYFMMANYIGPFGNGGIPKKINWMGVTSLILGVITIAMCWLSIFSFLFIIFLVLSIMVIIFGAIGVYLSQKNGAGKALAGAGLILGILSLLLTIFFLMIRLSRGYY